MSKHEKVQTAPLTQGEIFEFFGTVAEQLPRDLDPQKVRFYTEKKGRLGKEFRTLFAKPLPEFDISGWENFYEKNFGRTVDLSNLHIPPKPDYPCRAVVIVPSFTNNDVFDACTKAFGGAAWRYEKDLNTVRDVVKRPDGPYVVWVRDLVEADEEMKNKSADDIEKAGTNTLTLKERMVLELAYFDETRNHLDVENVTLCSGSRNSDGNVPNCNWNDGKFYVNWYNADNRNSNLRSRVAVSLPPYFRREFRSRNISQPYAIFDASINLSCKAKYFFFSIIFNSSQSRISCLHTSSTIRSFLSGVAFSDAGDRAASVASIRHSSITFSMRAHSPKRSRLGIFLLTSYNCAYNSQSVWIMGTETVSCYGAYANQAENATQCY